MNPLLQKIKQCATCTEHLPLDPKPVVSASPQSKILIIGQAPGIRVHNSGIPWNDPSGMQLRKWLNVTDEQFYDTQNMAIMPMGFCYPGTGKTGDLPPRKECAPQWHEALLEKMPEIQLTLLIGLYAQKYYLGKSAKKNLTETVKNYEEYLPQFLVTPHPSPRNRIWLKRNPWFELEVVPQLQNKVAQYLL